jgi:hypothetical protein
MVLNFCAFQAKSVIVLDALIYCIMTSSHEAKTDTLNWKCDGAHCIRWVWFKLKFHIKILLGIEIVCFYTTFSRTKAKIFSNVEQKLPFKLIDLSL